MQVWNANPTTDQVRSIHINQLCNFKLAWRCHRRDLRFSSEALKGERNLLRHCWSAACRWQQILLQLRPRLHLSCVMPSLYYGHGRSWLQPIRSILFNKSYTLERILPGFSELELVFEDFIHAFQEWNPCSHKVGQGIHSHHAASKYERIMLDCVWIYLHYDWHSHSLKHPLLQIEADLFRSRSHSCSFNPTTIE
jgi:hypothetical protein